jgi:hypothetical protein
VRFGSKPTVPGSSLGLALLAVLGFVDKSLLPKELLFSRREHKHHATTYAQDFSVGKRHEPPSTQSRFKRRATGRGKTAEILYETGCVPDNLYLLILKVCSVPNKRGIFFGPVNAEAHVSKESWEARKKATT